jgi:hypothetical protein
VKAGAVWPKSAAPATTASGKYVISPERKKFWSLHPLSTPAVPAVKDTKWAKTNIDKFFLANLEKQALKPVPFANKLDLIRRATLDLTGLPPTPEEISAFQKDTSPDAFAKVVDRLLESPHYGERWGRIWLDVARYGEDDYRSLNPNPKGYRPYPSAYAYRDCGIQSFNDDLPMTVRSGAVGRRPAGLEDSIQDAVATGLGLGPWYYDNGSNEVTRADERHDRVDAVTRGFLGLTVACARFDPQTIHSQTDYYSLAGVFSIHLKISEGSQDSGRVLKDGRRSGQEAEDPRRKPGVSQSVVTGSGADFDISAGRVTSAVSREKDIARVVETRKLDYELLTAGSSTWPSQRTIQEQRRLAGHDQEGRQCGRSQETGGQVSRGSRGGHAREDGPRQPEQSDHRQRSGRDQAQEAH